MYATLISAGIALFIVSAAHGMNNPQLTLEQQAERAQRAQEERAVTAAYTRTMQHIMWQEEQANRAEHAARLRRADQQNGG